MSNKSDVKKIMKKIEDETTSIVKDKNINKDIKIEDLTTIMQQGADEFKQKVGRNMTYSEMREMFG